MTEAMRRRESDTSKGKNLQGRSGSNSLLGPGVPAPDFNLRSTQSLRSGRETGAPGAPVADVKLQTLPPDQFISLSELRGRPVILAFYPADWSPVCGDEVALFNEFLTEFQRFNAGRPDADVTRFINAPTHVWVKEPRIPGDEAIDVESEDGTKTLLNFRHVSPEETERQLPAGA